MDGRAASQTITDKIPHLLAAGLELQVLSAVTGALDRQVPHRQLLPWGPSGFRFDFRHWVRLRIGKGVAYRSLVLAITLLLAPFVVIERVLTGFTGQWSWSLPAALVGAWRVRRGQADLVFSTGGAWSAHLAGWWIKRLTGVPWIAEIHDPMVELGRGFKKSREERARAWLERKICGDADSVWWFTDGALQMALARNPMVCERGFAVLAGAEPPPIKAQHCYGETLKIGHFGSLATSRNLSPFLEGLQIFLREQPQARTRIRVHVFGSAIDEISERTLGRLQLQDMVVAHGRLERDLRSGLSGREQVMKHMQESDALLLLHGMDPVCAEYIPSKFYEYLWARRPVFALTHLNPQLDDLLRQRYGYLAPSDDPEAISAQLRKLWSDWQNRSLPESPVGPISVGDAVQVILERLRSECATP
jgi:glycosyltransferase involved in cell wall biosynthesis